MEDLLIHTSNVRVDVLEPYKTPEDDKPCICFSLNQFIPFFGEYVYLFQRKVLARNFFIKQIPSSGVALYSTTHFEPTQREHWYRSQRLEYEFRIYRPIDVREYCVGIITGFNHMKGVLETRIMDKIIKEQVDFS